MLSSKKWNLVKCSETTIVHNFAQHETMYYGVLGHVTVQPTRVYNRTCRYSGFGLSSCEHYLIYFVVFADLK